jgi:hypothetical protein
VRQSRFGVKGGKKLGSADAQVKLEADFYGGFPGVGLNETFALPRLRIASFTVTAGAWRVTAGQDWVIFAPLLPDTLSHQAVPGWATAGNLWARQWQVQGGWKRKSGSATIDVGAALLAPVDLDAPNPNIYAFAPAFGPGERSAMPAGEARVAVSLPLGAAKKPSSVGASARGGRERWVIAGGTEDVTLWGAALDITLELPNVTVLAECFLGQDLGAFMGGVLQGVRKTPGAMPTDPITDVTPVRTRGGFAQVIVAVGGGVGVAVGAGLDDPDDDDVGAMARGRNLAGMGTLFWRRGEVELALEGEYFATDYVGADGLSALSVNLGGIYRF